MCSVQFPLFLRANANRASIATDMAKEDSDGGQEQEAAQEAATSSGAVDAKRLIILIVGLLVVVLILGGAAAFFLMSGGGEKEAPVAERPVVEQVGPRSILEGVAKLQSQFKGKSGDFSGDIRELWAEHVKEPKGISPALAEILDARIQSTNLLIRKIPNGFEIALRKDDVSWLVFAKTGTLPPRVSTQETGGSPPFTVAGGPVAAAEVKVQELVEFKDPLKYFTVMLPGGFATNDGSQGQTARISFSYESGVRMTVKAMEFNRPWDAQAELSAKSEQIRSGSVPAFAEFELTVTNLLDVEGASGYEMGLVGKSSKVGVQTHSFVFGGEGTMLSIALISSASSAVSLYDALVASVRDTLRVGPGPAPAGGRRKASHVEEDVEPAKPQLTPEQLAAWNEARGLLKTTGILKSGDAYVALVNDSLLHVNETITVSIKGKAFKFLVTTITVDQVDFEPILTNSTGEQDRVKM